MSNYNVVNQFNLESNDFKIHVSFNTPIKFEPNWTYYIKLLNVQFSNVVPNVETDLYVSGVKMCDIGVYNIIQLITEYNNLGSYGELSLNPNTGKLRLTNNTGSTLTITASTGHVDFLTTEIAGFNSLPTNIPNNGSVDADKVVKIQDFNYFVLSSENISGYTYTNMADKNKLAPCNILWPFPSTIQPLATKSWTAIQPVEFELSGSTIQYLDFEMKDGRGRTMTILPTATTDFSLLCQIVRRKQMPMLTK